MNYPSAVNVARLPQAYVPDTSRQAQQMAGLVSGIAQDYKQAANQKRANSLADQLLDGSIQENPKTEAEEQAQRQLKNSILQTEIVNAKEEQASMSLQAKAEQQRKVIRENTRLQQIMASPEDKKALVELMQLDKQLAGSVLDILKADDAQAKQAMAAASADALQTYSNYQVLMQQHGKPVADEFALAKAREIYSETQDPHSVRHLMAMRSASGDEAMAIANTQSALAGATLKVPEVQKQLDLIGKVDPEEYTQDSLRQFQQTGDYSVLERRPEAPQDSGGNIAPVSAKDFTAESLASYKQSGNPGDLVRIDQGATKRKNDVIQRGVEAARSVPLVRRSIELLDEVKTGGINAVALRAKQAFGVEGANEAELSTNLGKAVLSQLKDTFGAQFTVEEGKRLERIEAGFGKSVEGNKRLLGQLLKMSEMKVRQARRRAESSGDFDTLDEIDEYMNMSLSTEESEDDIFNKYGLN